MTLLASHLLEQRNAVSAFWVEAVSGCRNYSSAVHRMKVLSHALRCHPLQAGRFPLAPYSYVPTSHSALNLFQTAVAIGSTLALRLDCQLTSSRPVGGKTSCILVMSIFGEGARLVCLPFLAPSPAALLMAR